MKKFIMVIIISLIVFYLGVFTVKEHQVVFVSNKYNNKTQLYNVGLHFTLPVINKLTYIDLNKHVNVLAITVKLPNKNQVLTSYQLNNMVVYHVSVPETYFNYQKSHSEFKTHKAISTILEELIQAKISRVNNIDNLNQIKDFIVDPVFIPTLGIIVDSVTLKELY